MLEQLQAWYKKYPVSSHGIAVAITTLILAYSQVPQFHGLVTTLIAVMPKGVITTLVALWSLYSWYKTHGAVAPPGSANAAASTSGIGAAPAALGILLLAIVMGSSITGCAHKANTVPVGAFNQFDSDTYNTLLTAQAALIAAKTQFASTPAAVPLINKAIAAYNLAETTYQTWHAAGGSGSSTALAADMSDLVSDIADLQSQFAPPGK